MGWTWHAFLSTTRTPNSANPGTCSLTGCHASGVPQNPYLPAPPTLRRRFIKWEEVESSLRTCTRPVFTPWEEIIWEDGLGSNSIAKRNRLSFSQHTCPASKLWGHQAPRHTLTSYGEQSAECPMTRTTPGPAHGTNSRKP